MINKTQIKKVFASNTEKHEVFVTSNGIVFFDRSHAVNHAKNLGDNHVTAVTRAEAETSDSDEERLEAIDARKKAIMDIMDQFKPEWEALEKEAQEIFERQEKARLESLEGENQGADILSLGTVPGGDQNRTGSESSTGETGSGASAEGEGEPSGKKKSNKGK